MTRLALFLTLIVALGPPFDAAAQDGAPDGMVRVDGGTYTPLYKGAGDGRMEVAPFYLDVYPVTNAEFLAFVEAKPEWRRSNAKALFAGDGYLRHWADDLDLGDAALADRPVVNVSWFAARAYAEWKGRRLPTVAEWEYAASASEARPDGRSDPAFLRRVLGAYSRSSGASLEPVGSTFENYWGLFDMHGLVWEWTYDFNSSLVTGESRNDTDLDVSLFCGSASLGATDFRDYAAFIRFAYRSGLEGDYAVSKLGFRLAAEAQ